MAGRDYKRYTGTLPYASEMFGIYRPMIGWDSKRKRDLTLATQASGIVPLVMATLVPSYRPAVQIQWVDPGNPRIDRLEPGRIHDGVSVRANGQSLLFAELADFLAANRAPEDLPRSPEQWAEVLDEGRIAELLRGPVRAQWESMLREQVNALRNQPPREGEDEESRSNRVIDEVKQASASFSEALDAESAAAGMVIDLVRSGTSAVLEKLFYNVPGQIDKSNLTSVLSGLQQRLTDPFAEFDPSVGLPGVSVSPLGIVHLFRQYFFEFDTFLGSPVGHVWLSPGSSVELIETSTRKSTVERSVETETETRVQTERTSQEQDELSEAVKKENREDSKLGFSTTLTEKWPTGSATATGSLNLDTTQQLAREDTHKRLREQTEKLSTDIRNDYKTTFKTVTETTDTSSKRYVLANNGKDLVNYEMRRKMRQVGVQVQDVGTYLCWETFVDEPGQSLGLADLVHIAKPGDIAPQPNLQEIPPPPNLPRPFTVNARWDFKEPKRNEFERAIVPGGPIVPGHIPVGQARLTFGIESGYKIGLEVGGWIPLRINSIDGDQGQRYNFIGVWTGEDRLHIGVIAGIGGLEWDEPVGFTLAGDLTLVPTAEKLAEVDAANAKLYQDAAAATREQQRANDEAAFYAAAKERIEQASAITQRPFDDLREEERTVVYRALIRDLMARDTTTPDSDDDNYDTASYQRRHVYSTVLNAIFDIDKMLYFVAPEWWKPRHHYSQSLGSATTGTRDIPSASLVNWSDSEDRLDNYYITSKSRPARLGSSLGWLLQLDGDDNRNRFLNSPWVRAVIPIRPGKEQAALNWLTKAQVEGSDGLADTYANTAEYDEIRTGLQAAGLPASNPPTIEDTIRYLAVRVADKHKEGSTVELFPDRPDVPDKDKVWATPVDKVYEHGFYPLERSFQFDPTQEPADVTGSTNFHCIAQWTEILPTDQIVPVEVAYDPTTGRQIPPRG